MKRMVVLVVALVCLIVGTLMDSSPAQAENSGDHFVKGQVLAIEACYGNATRVGSTCLGVIGTSDGEKHTAKISEDVQIGKIVYRECSYRNEGLVCNKLWGTSVGETYMRGGEVK